MLVLLIALFLSCAAPSVSTERIIGPQVKVGDDGA